MSTTFQNRMIRKSFGLAFLVEGRARIDGAQDGSEMILIFHPLVSSLDTSRSVEIDASLCQILRRFDFLTVLSTLRGSLTATEMAEVRRTVASARAERLHAKKLSDIKPYSRCSAATAAI
jgi:hypothetical protein